jgi:hypothetical protein
VKEKKESEKYQKNIKRSVAAPAVIFVVTPWQYSVLAWEVLQH